MTHHRFFYAATRVLAVVAAATITSASPAVPAVFTVSPTQVFLTAGAASTMLTLRNESAEPLRFQLEAFKWDQSHAGEMQLTATEDVVFFPQLFTLAAHAERKIRVGTRAAFGTTESTYRLFVQELPPLARQTADPSGVQMRTSMGIPIFMQPALPVATGSLTDPAATAGRLFVTLSNSGNAHFIADTVSIGGRNATGGQTFTKTLTGWYILAGGAQTFSFSMTDAECRATVSLQAEVTIGTATLRSQSVIEPSGCPAQR